MVSLGINPLTYVTNEMDANPHKKRLFFFVKIFYIEKQYTEQKNKQMCLICRPADKPGLILGYFQR